MKALTRREEIKSRMQLFSVFLALSSLAYWLLSSVLFPQGYSTGQLQQILSAHNMHIVIPFKNEKHFLRSNPADLLISYVIDQNYVIYAVPRRPKQTFLQRYTDGPQAHEKMLSNANIREMQIKPAMKYHFPPVRKSTKNGEGVQKMEPSYTVSRNLNWSMVVP